MLQRSNFFYFDYKSFTEALSYKLMHKIASHQKQLIERDQLQFYLGLILIKKTTRRSSDVLHACIISANIVFSSLCVSKIMDVPLN